MSVTKFENANKRQNDAVVHILKAALRLAESGELRDVAIHGVLTGNSIYTNYTEYDVPLMIGTLEIVKDGLITVMRENQLPVRDPEN